MMSSSGMCRRSSSGVVVRPQPVTEPSFLETVGSFINDVQSIHHGGHPPSSANSPLGDSARNIHVTWARFETWDINDVGLFPEMAEINGNSPPLLLILGYTSGVQVWLIPITGEAQEVLSWKQGQVKSLRILPTPENVFGCAADNFAHVRPLIAMSDATGPGAAYTSASFLSLKSGEQVHNIKFNSEIVDIVVNRKVILMTFKEKLAVFNACNLEARFTITTCFPSPGVDSNPISLGDRWLAYADQKMVPIHRSFGGMEMDGSQSVTAWGINVGSKLAQGVSKICSNIFASSPSSSAVSNATLNNEPQKGVITILDILQVNRPDADEELNVADKIEGVIAHFIAHNKAIVALKFDYSGSLLLSCDRLGNYFNLFKIVPHPGGACYAAVHHLYSLYRGDTPGSVQDIAFSPDSRWVAVSTLRGTTHLFPITPYGGNVGVRTHTSHRVVNRLSRFHRSAGIDTDNRNGRTSPNPVMGSSPVATMAAAAVVDQAPPPVMPYPNPHVPPFPPPTLIQPVAQLRQPYLISSLRQLGGTVSSSSRKGGRSTSEDVPIRLACCFAPSRAWLVGTQHNMFKPQLKNKNMDALYIMANHGTLLEYSLDPIPDPTLPKEKICESSPVELSIQPYGQWSMSKPRDRSDLQPPLPIDNPLMMPLDQMGILKDSAMSSNLNDDEDLWLSQVEIITHIGPHRRLWMGPQFSFKTLQHINDSNEVQVMDVTSRPQQSNPVNMIGRHGNVPVLIEAGSASSSFELSPRFANNFYNKLGSREAVHQDVESELQEAMTETVVPEDNLLDGNKHKEEEFFCLTPDDSRSINSSTTRSRNASSASVTISASNTINDTKIFSVAVEARKVEPNIVDTLTAVDVDSDFNGRFAVVSESKKKTPLKTAEHKELTPTGFDEDLLQMNENSASLLAEAVESVVAEPLKMAAKSKPAQVEKSSVEEEEEDEEEDFFISEDKESSVEKEDNYGNSSTKPAEPYKWMDDIFGPKDSNSIIKDIAAAGKKYEDDYSPNSSGGGLFSDILKTKQVWKNPPDTTTSEDEVFVPASNRRKKKQQRNSTANNYKNSYLNDSAESTEDEKVDVEVNPEPEGWSFEADDLDVNRIINEVVNDTSKTANNDSDEKVLLEDVFKFDSEIQKEEKSNVVNESTAANESADENNRSNDDGLTSGGVSTTSASESSVGNSPNVKKTKGRNKKKKGRR